MTIGPISKEIVSFLRTRERILQRLSLHRYIHLIPMSTVLKDRSKSHPRTSHETLERQYSYSSTVSLTVALCVVAGDIHTATGRVSPGTVICFTV